MIYGATGYTGRLIAEQVRQFAHARRRCRADSRPCAGAGRRARHRRARLSRSMSRNVLIRLLTISTCCQCGQPVRADRPALIEACLRTRTHYLDITGELPVFQRRLRLRRSGAQTRHHDHAGRRSWRRGLRLPGDARGLADPQARNIFGSALLRPNRSRAARFAPRSGLSNSRVAIRRNGRADFCCRSAVCNAPSTLATGAGKCCRELG